MRLSIVMLDSTSTVNNLKYLNQVQIMPGSTAVVMFQLIDLDSPRGSNGIFNRYLPASGATMSLKTYSSNDANKLTKTPTQSFGTDGSIWQMSLSAVETAKVAGVNMQITLTEGTSIQIATVPSVLIVTPANPFRC